MSERDAFRAALKGETSTATIYWDTQDPQNIGAAYRLGDESGALEFIQWAHISGRPLAAEETLGYNVGDYFRGPGGRYNGPDSDGIYPVLI